MALLHPGHSDSWGLCDFFLCIPQFYASVTRSVWGCPTAKKGLKCSCGLGRRGREEAWEEEGRKEEDGRKDDSKEKEGRREQRAEEAKRQR